MSDIERVRRHGGGGGFNCGDNGVFYMSCLKWLDFTSISNPYVKPRAERKYRIGVSDKVTVRHAPIPFLDIDYLIHRLQYNIYIA